MLDNEIKLIRDLVEAGGPQPSQYPFVHIFFHDVMQRYRLGEITAEDIASLRAVFGDDISHKTMQGFVARKPHGYHGDFEVIDRIYTQWVSPDPKMVNWDHFFHSCDASTAVRNRKDFFHTVLDTMKKTFPKRELNILSVGSGPARDVAEFLARDTEKQFRFTCLDQDPRAIAHAEALCKPWADRVSFVKTDVIRRLPDETFDLVWSAGLFDYFSDRIVVLMLKRLSKRVAPGGQMIIGNFGPENSSRDYMEFGGWNLIHRTPAELLLLASQAEIPAEACTVKSECQGVNLFLEVKH